MAKSKAIRCSAWRRKWQPTPVSCLENPMDRGAWWAAVHRSQRVGHDWATKQKVLRVRARQGLWLCGDRGQELWWWTRLSKVKPLQFGVNATVQGRVVTMLESLGLSLSLSVFSKYQTQWCFWLNTVMFQIVFKDALWDFPCGPVVKTLSSQCRWPVFHPLSGN